MQLKVIRKMLYEAGDHSSFVYVMNFDNIFWYLFIWNSEIYQHNIKVPVKLWTRIKNYFNSEKHPLFTEKEIEEFEGVMLSGATRSIDALFLRDIKNIDPNKENDILIPVEK